MSEVAYRHRRKKTPKRRGRRPRVQIKGFTATPRGRYEKAAASDLKIHELLEKYNQQWIMWQKNKAVVNEIVDTAAKVWPFPDYTEFYRHHELQAQLRATGAGVRDSE